MRKVYRHSIITFLHKERNCCGGVNVEKTIWYVDVLGMGEYKLTSDEDGRVIVLNRREMERWMHYTRGPVRMIRRG